MRRNVNHFSGKGDRASSEPNRVSKASPRIGKRVSLGKAAEMAGYSKGAFMDLLSEKGIPVANVSPDDLDRELDA